MDKKVFDSLLNVFFNKTDRFVCFMDFHGVIFHANQRWIEVLGFDESGLNIVYFLNEEEICKWSFLGDNFITELEKKNNCFKSVLKKKDGSQFPVEISVLYEKNDTNKYCILEIKDITEEKNKEDYIKKLNATLESTSDAVYWGNKYGKFDYVNNRACEMLGYTKEEFKNISVFDIDKNFKDKELDQDMSDSINSKQDHNLFLETFHQTKKGESIPVEVNSTRVWLDSEWFVLSFARDISKRKQRENDLLRNQKLLRESQRIAKIGSWEQNLTDQSLEWSDEVFSMLGYERGELGPNFNNLKKIMPDDDAIKVKEVIDRIIKDKCFYDHEHRIIKKNGDIIHVYVAGDVVLNDEGDVKRIFGVIQDITERKQNEKALFDSERKMQRIFEVAPVGLGILKDRVITKVNSYVCKISGYSEKELVGSNTQILFPDKKEYERIGRVLYPEMNKNGIGRTEALWKRENGKLINVLMGIALIDLEDASKGAIATAIDITKQKKVQQQLLEAKKRAEQSDRLKSSFLANMSHEIRTPMNAIIGFSSFLKDDDLSKEELYRYADIISSSGEYLLALINDIIDISKIDSGQIDIISTNVNINRLLDEIFNFFQSYLVAKNKRNLKIELEISKDIIIAHTDEMRLKQILINLIGNAVKFTEKGFVKIVCIKEGNFLKFNIQDTGIGISKASQKIIFERFRQGNDSVEKNYGGTGLGLSIAKACIELLGGEISLSSEVGKGTNFYFTIQH